MALKAEAVTKLKATLKGFDVDKLIAAIKAEAEEEYPIPEVKVFTDTELASRDESQKNNGIKIGKEFAIKDLKADVGLDYDGEGSKDPKKFAEEYKKKIINEAGIKESEKVRELNTTIEQLRTNLTNATTEKESFIRQSKEAQLETQILSDTLHLKPDNLTNKEWVTILKMNNEIIEQDGSMVVKRDGKIVANQTDLKPIPVKDALITYIDERKIGKVTDSNSGGGKGSGRGADDSKTSPAGISNMKQFKEYLSKKEINPNGDRAKSELKAITDANPNFVFSE